MHSTCICRVEEINNNIYFCLSYSWKKDKTYPVVYLHIQENMIVQSPSHAWQCIKYIIYPCTPIFPPNCMVYKLIFCFISNVSTLISVSKLQ